MRLNHMEVWPDGGHAIVAMDRAVRAAGLEPEMLELVKVRASQVNGCAYCLDIHVKDARAIGVDQLRLDLVATWRDAPGYSDRERAALAWCEALTLVAQTGGPDADWEAVTAVFSRPEAVALTLAIVAINAWNRYEIAFRSPAGNHVSRRRPPEPPPGS